MTFLWFDWKSGEPNPKSTIKFTSSHSPTNVPFLDVDVSLTSEGSINTDLYTKPTDKHQHLLSLFFLSSSTHKKAIHFSLALRLRRNVQDSLYWANDIYLSFRVKGGYKCDLGTKQTQRTAEIPRIHTVQSKQINKPERIPFITTYNPSFPSIFNVIKNTTIYCFPLTAAKILSYIYLLWLSDAPLTCESGTGPQMIPGRQMIPEPQTIPKLYRKWYQDRKWSQKKNKEWHGGWNGLTGELMGRALIFIKIA